ncbi:sigma-70 family RNA polymerase sigma factor [Kribbella sp. CA-293567]|uniref:sigma-70 family RNA polymerase sigma factor n=1 Tax=Kribbella sp. CA-293567 TaxID=3002436 RepID=UPI0022DE7F68|nr:sigma-70 family RNA polymerase sigma factor [Kribbella sp. CA-293567]WBQ07201.1 sigma-70 family RNA polymerase sigma factor [Kribbella sp. CA-293567]
METPEGPSDAELIARVRNGDLEAYGELFGRHHQAAERMARQLVPANDADDLASDAFAKVLDALRNGGGPDISFRAYLLTTVRRVHVDRIRSGRKVQTTDDIAAYEREPQGFDDPSVTGFESGAAAKAFASLPERWQAVLWHTEVEGEKPAAIAPLLGLTANGVSALAYRAREGLRQAYLQQHLADVASDRCRWTTERLGAYVRGGLTKRENKNVREHLDECAKCTAVYLELVEVNSALPALLAPALLGTAGLGYLAAASGAKVGIAGFLVTGWQKVTENSTRTAVGAGTVVVVVVAAVIAAMALTGNETPPAAIEKPPTQQPTQPPVNPPVNPPPVKPPTVKPPVVPPTTKPDPTTAPPPEPTTAPTSAPTTTPPTTPTPTPTRPEPTTPILDEGLLTISAPQGGGAAGGRAPYGPAARAEAIEEAAASATWLITIKVPAANKKPVVIGIKYGSALQWPLRANPAGWSCVKATGNCTATNPASPATMPVAFAAPTGGTAAQRTFTVSAKSGRLYDDDSQTLNAPAPPPQPQPRLDESLLKLSTTKTAPDSYLRTITIAPGVRTSVTVKIQYGSALSWPFTGSPAGWKCTQASRTCTAANPARPAPLYGEFAVPEGSSAARTYSVAATAGLLYDTDSETLPGPQPDESLLRIVTPDPHNDPNPFVYNRFLTIGGTTGRVTLEISWGRNLSLVSYFNRGWTCSRSTDVRRATCSTNNYTRPLNTEWAAWPGTGTANTITVTATTAGRYDTDAAGIPPGKTRR